MSSLKNGDTLRAHVCFTEAIAHELIAPVAWLNLGVVYHANGRHVKRYNACVLLWNRPDEADTHHNLALILWDMGRTDEAVVANRNVLEIDPTHLGAMTLHWRMGCMGWEAPRALVVGPSILGCSRAHGAMANYLRLVGFSVWAQAEVVDLLNHPRVEDRIAEFMDRSEPSLLVLSSQGTDTHGIEEAAARAIPIVCETADGVIWPDEVAMVSTSPRKRCGVCNVYRRLSD